MFYHGGLNHIIKVKMGKLLLCVDRPERTSILQVCDHNGKFSIFWGHSCKVDGYCKENHLPSCKESQKHRLHKIISGRQYESNETDLMLACERTEHIHAESHAESHVLQQCNGRKCASRDVFHPSFTFLHQQTIQPTMINGLVPHFLLMEGSLTFQFKEHNECCMPFV